MRFNPNELSVRQTKVHLGYKSLRNGYEKHQNQVSEPLER